MAKLIPARGAQYPLVAEYTFNFDDTVVNTSGVTVDFGKTNTAATTIDIAPLPLGAVVIGGEVVTTTAFDAATYNVTVGDATTANRYLGSTDKKGTGRTALVPTGFVSTGEKLQLTFTPADACTAGKATVRVMYVINARVKEVFI